MAGRHAPAVYLHLLCTLAWRGLAKHTASQSPRVTQWVARQTLRPQGHFRQGKEVHPQICHHLLLEENAPTRVPIQGP